MKIYISERKRLKNDPNIHRSVHAGWQVHHSCDVILDVLFEKLSRSDDTSFERLA
jgi:hypothetical protein